MRKTNAMRVLEAHKIPYQAIEYDAQGAFHSAEEAARLIGASVETVYKTLVVLREMPPGKPMLVMIAANCELDLRALAHRVGAKKLRMATKKQAEQLTGAQIGGISALALLNRGFEVYIDRSALTFEWIHVSGGARGLDLKLRPADLVRITGAQVIDLWRNQDP